MSVLLRQPHGFKGVGVVPEVVHAGNLSLPERVHDRDLHVRFRSAPGRAPDEPDDNVVSDVFEVADWFGGLCVPRLAQLPEPADDCLLADKRARLRPIFRRANDDVGVEQLGNGIPVARVPMPRRRLARSPRSPATSPAQYLAQRSARRTSIGGRFRLSQAGLYVRFGGGAPRS